MTNFHRTEICWVTKQLRWGPAVKFIKYFIRIMMLYTLCHHIKVFLCTEEMIAIMETDSNSVDKNQDPLRKAKLHFDHLVTLSFGKKTEAK